jgi:hypothetical protein
VIEAVAFCPQAPALVPEVGRGLDAELDEVRTATRTALQDAARGGEQLIVIGSADTTRPHDPTARGSFAGFGVPLTVPLGSDEPGPLELPQALTVGAWLLRDALGPGCGASGWSVGWDSTARGIAPDRPTVLVVVGDGSARLSEKAPGYLDPRAAARDQLTLDALSSGEGGRLHPYPELDDELLVAGARAWRATAWQTEASSFDADLRYAGAPFGVGYFVAVWTRSTP